MPSKTPSVSKANTLALEREILSEYGNMSAATLLFVLERTLRRGASGRMLLRREWGRALPSAFRFSTPRERARHRPFFTGRAAARRRTPVTPRGTQGLCSGGGRRRIRRRPLFGLIALLHLSWFSWRSPCWCPGTPRGSWPLLWPVRKSAGIADLVLASLDRIGRRESSFLPGAPAVRAPALWLGAPPDYLRRSRTEIAGPCRWRSGGGGGSPSCCSRFS